MRIMRDIFISKLKILCEYIIIEDNRCIILNVIYYLILSFNNQIHIRKETM